MRGHSCTSSTVTQFIDKNIEIVTRVLRIFIILIVRLLVNNDLEKLRCIHTSYTQNSKEYRFTNRSSTFKQLNKNKLITEWSMDMH